MKNFIGVSRGYFERQAKPELESVKSTIEPVVKTYTIAGKKIRIFFYGTAVAQSLPLAMSHNEASFSGDAELTIYAWDSSGSPQPLPAPWDETHFKQEQTVTDGTFFGVYISGEETLNFYDATTKTGYFWTQDASQLPDWAAGAPFRTILHWFLSDEHIHMMHGAVVGHNGKTVLLTAKSGSGKSTTSIACLLGGMDYLGDDYAAISKAGPTAYSMYHSGKVTEQGLTLFPELHDRVWNKNFKSPEKAVIFFADHFPNQIKTEAPLHAILIPKITADVTRIVPASKIEALLAIAPTTLFQLPWAETKKVGAFKEIIEITPCYFLELGPDIRGIPEVIREFLSN